MKTRVINIGSDGEGLDEAIDSADLISMYYSLDKKLARQLRLLSEELLETVRHMAGDYKASFHIESTENLCEIKLEFLTDMSSEKRTRILEISDEIPKNGNISERIRRILESRFYEKEENEDLLKKIGIIKTHDTGVGEELDESDGDIYVWSLQSFALSSYDSSIENSDLDSVWTDISRSILLNLADDVRIYIFKNRVEVAALKNLKNPSIHDSNKEYDISPEFEKLKLIPVVSTKTQVRIAQLLYKQLPAKEVSNYLLKISRHQITVDTSPKRTLTTLIYTPTELENDKDTPCIILYHGGALVLPPLLYHFRLARIFANNVRCKVMMPLYDLAPKYLPPLQHEEAYYFYKHLRENASEYNINPEKIVVAGDSAGGTLCAALCLMARDRNLPLPYAQMLFYPSLDASLSSESMKKYTDVPIVNAKAVREYYKMCRMDAYKGNRDYASPAEAGSLKGMPPSYVETAEFDCLHDDGIKYASRLRDSGCDVVLNETRGTVHAFDMAKNSRILENVMQQRISFLRDVYGE